MQSKKRRIRSFENLENRLTFAGDVTTNLTAGVLTITGDADANGFTLTTTAPGEFRLVGITHDGSATKIDGVDNDTVDFTGVTEVIINTNAEDDLIEIQLPFDFSGDMTIDGGTGGDILTVGKNATLSEMTGDLTITMSDGDDTVDLQKFTLTGDLSIDAGADNDNVTLGNSSSVYQTTVTGTTLITGGAGNDTIDLEFVTLSDPLTINGDAGNDTITFGTTTQAATISDNATITTVAGTDTVRFVNATMTGNLSIDSGDNDDIVDLQKLTLTGPLTINAGADNDTVTLGNSALELLTTVSGVTVINGGTGNDTIALPFATLANELTINGEAGNDIVTFGSTATGTNRVFTSSAKVSINTAAGNDEIRLNNVDITNNKNLFINSGDNDDIVTFGTNDFTARIFGEILIQGGAGTDAIRFNRSVTSGKMSIDGGDGDDTIAFGTAATNAVHSGNLIIQGGLGLDTIRLQSISQASGTDEELEISGGDGNDSIILGSATRAAFVNGPITIRAGLGNDTISLPRFNIGGEFVINTGDGTDTITLGSDAAYSGNLTGVLSIRTQAGTKTITQKNVNIIGNQDVSAAQTNNGGTASNAQSVTIEDSTFGSFLYFDFGGRLASLSMTDTIQTGSLYVYNRVETDPVLNGDDRVIVQVNQNLTFSYLNSQMAGNLILDATTKGLFTIENSTITGAASLKSVGSTNSLGVTNSAINVMQFISRDTYTVSDAVFPVIKNERVVESTNDNVQLTNVTVNGTTSLESAGSISLNNVNSGLTVLSALNNSLAFIRTNASRFTDLILRLGSTPHPNETNATSSDSTVNDVTNAEVTNTIVTGTLTLDSTSRVKSIQYFTSQGALEQGTAINQARANYSIIGSQVGTLFMPPVNDSAPNAVPDAEPGVNFLNITNSALTSVNVSLPRSSDTVNINGSSVAVATYLNGGGGNNLLNRNNSTLNGLQKINFAN